jgi:hypothetical protein
MPIIKAATEPWKPMRAAVDAVTAAASRALDPVLDFAMAYPPPRPSPEPLDWVVVVAQFGVIKQLSDPLTFDAARKYQTKIQEADYGEVATHIVKKSVAAMLKEGMMSTAILDVMES